LLLIQAGKHVLAIKTCFIYMFVRFVFNVFRCFYVYF